MTQKNKLPNFKALYKMTKPATMKYPKLVEQMKRCCKHHNGLGLAANQLGKTVRLAIVLGKPMYNLRIATHLGTPYDVLEGCLSFHTMQSVQRYPTVWAYYQDENFNSHLQEFHGLEAQVIQHEHDHLEGITIKQRAKG